MDDVRFVPMDPGYAVQIEAWAPSSATKELLKLPEFTIGDPYTHNDLRWVALRNNAPIAVASIQFNQQHLSYIDILVKPTERRQGIGARLLGYVLAQPAVQSLGRLRAVIEFDNIAAQKILTRNGFSSIGHTDDGYDEYERH